MKLSLLPSVFVALPLLAVDSEAQTLSTREVASGLSQPIWAGSPPGDDRIFVAQQRGAVVVFENGAPAGFFLDAGGLVLNGSERGLLGMAFHPNYRNNGTFYLNYTRAGDGATVVSSWQVSASDPNRADPSSESVLLVQSQPFSNHNAGGIEFGPDGYLYITFGDGGSANDPGCRAQNLGTWLGKILRIDVDGGTPYAVPPDNPFVGTAGALPEIYHLGVRNPWRMTFDRQTGDLFIGDVGQNAREEISFAANGESGVNFGWKIMEGTRCNQLTACPVNQPGCGASDYRDPIYELIHGGLQGPEAIIAGYVYRGCAIPALQGTFFFADYNDDIVRSFVYDVGTGTVNDFMDRTAELDPPGPAALTNISSFGEDGFGEMLIVTRPGTAGAGAVYKIVPSTAVAAVASLRNGGGTNATCYTSQSLPILGNLWRGEIDTSSHPGATSVGIVGYRAGTSGTFLPGGELLVDLSSPKVFQVLKSTTGGVETIRAPIPCDTSLNGALAFSQAFLLGGGSWSLCNAVDITVGMY